MSVPVRHPSDTWEIGDNCVVKDNTRVWKIIGFIGDGQTHGGRIADLAPVGFKFEGTHSAYTRDLRDVPR